MMRKNPMVTPEQILPIRIDRLSGEIDTPVATPEIIARTHSTSRVYARLAVVLDTLETMPRFFFHCDCEDRATLDHCGVDLPDFASARAWAETEARHLLAPEMPLGLAPLTCVITIADEDGNILAQIAVREVPASPA
jgi:hypothetical protein